MTTKVTIPQAGMGITDGTIGRWLKAEGDSVTEGEIIVEIEFAKAVQEVAAPVSGMLSRILLAAGETGDVGATIATIE